MFPPSAISEQEEIQPELPASMTNRAAILSFRHTCWTALRAQRGIVAFLPMLVGLGLLFYGASGQIFAAASDATRYQCYALAFWQGSQGTGLLPTTACAFLSQSGAAPASFPAFSLVPFEYPPLTLSLFSLPLALPLLSYPVAFALFMALVAALLFWLLQRYGPRGSALAYAFYLVLGAFATAEARFDLVPAGLTLLCLIAAQRRHFLLAYTALALAFLLKIYPLLLLPALFLAEQIDSGRIYRPSASAGLRTLPAAIWRALCSARRWNWRHMLYFCGLSVGISGLFALLNFQGAFVNQLSYFTDRPVQIESMGSSLLWLATLLGHSASVVYSFGSYNLVSDLDSVVDAILNVCFVLSFALLILWQWRGKLGLAQTFSALILIFIGTSKVFSPQYLIWLIPLLVYSGAFSRRWLALWGSISLLTTLIYPYYYMSLPILQLPAVPGFIAVVALRNFLLIVATLALLFPEHFHRPWSLMGRFVKK